MNTPTRWVITGHSRGLGAAMVDAALAAGHDVLGLSRQSKAGTVSPAHAVAPATSLPHAPGRLTQAHVDLADTASLLAWLASGALADFARGAQRLILVNNAGMVHPVAPLGAQDAPLVAAAVALNITAPLLLANAVAGLTVVPERRVLHISSGAGRSAYPGWSVYGATKAALDHHARCAEQDAVAGVRVCSLAPGVIDTDMQADIRSASPEQFPLLPRFLSMKAEGQLATPEAAAASIVGYALSEGFGAEVVSDIRKVSGG